MRQFVTGLVLAVVLIGAILIVPRFVQPGEATAAQEAEQQAELARRLLHQFDPVTLLAHERAQPEALRSADLEQALADESAQQMLAELQQQFSAEVQSARSSDQRNRVEPSELRPAPTSPGAIGSAISEFDRFAGEQRKLLQAAASAAQAAAGASSDAPAVKEIQAAVKLAEARRSLAAAVRVRTRLRSLESQAEHVASNWARQQSEVAHFAAIEVGPTVEQLGRDVEDLNAQLAAVQSSASELAAIIAERDQELSQVREQLRQAQDEMLRLQDAGFTPGNDASFDAYRDRLVAVATRVRDLQAREHLLAYGGVEGGQVVPNDDGDGDQVIGGEAFFGVTELRRRLSLINDKIERFTAGVRALELQRETVGVLKSAAQEQEQLFRQRQQQTRARFDELVAEVRSLSEQALALEDDALSAANAAAAAFDAAQRVARNFKSAAREARQKYDPQGLNPRLKLITADDVPEQSAGTGAAEARMLIGRICAERADGVAALLAANDRIAAMMPEYSFDAEALQAKIDEARQIGVEALSAAKETYAPLVDGGAETSWVYAAALAGVELLSARLNPDQADTFRGQALDALDTVAEKAGASSYAAMYIQLRDTLRR